MVRTRLFRLVCVLSLLLLPTFPLAAVAQPGPAETFSEVFSKLSTWWNAAWADAGCYIDPHGGCAPARSEPVFSEAGCYIDPNGGCAPEAPAPSNLDEGCYIDPSGGCRDRS
jgi:hypothetical protein